MRLRLVLPLLLMFPKAVSCWPCRGRIAGVSCRHRNLHRARTHRNIDDDGIVFKIDLVTSPVGAAENCEHVMALVKWVRCVAAQTVAASAEHVNM